MPRSLRIEYAGACYHLMSRGDRQEDIFVEEGDRLEFLRLLGQACVKTGWQVHAYCLMTNHFHLVAETPQPNLVAGMRWFLGSTGFQSAAPAVGPSFRRSLQGAVDR